MKWTSARMASPRRPRSRAEGSAGVEGREHGLEVLEQLEDQPGLGLGLQERRVGESRGRRRDVPRRQEVGQVMALCA